MLPAFMAVGRAAGLAFGGPSSGGLRDRGRAAFAFGCKSGCFGAARGVVVASESNGSSLLDFG